MTTKKYADFPLKIHLEFYECFTKMNNTTNMVAMISNTRQSSTSAHAHTLKTSHTHTFTHSVAWYWLGDLLKVGSLLVNLKDTCMPSYRSLKSMECIQQAHV